MMTSQEASLSFVTADFDDPSIIFCDARPEFTMHDSESEDYDYDESDHDEPVS